MHPVLEQRQSIVHQGFFPLHFFEVNVVMAASAIPTDWRATALHMKESKD